MDAPKCRLCGDRHYGLCVSFAGKKSAKADTGAGGRKTRKPAEGIRAGGPASGGTARKAPIGKALTAAKSLPPSARRGKAKALPSPAPARPSFKNAAGKFDRNAYQRWLMQQRRAKARAAK